MAHKNKDTGTVGPDISQLRNPINITGKPIEQILKSVHYGSPELRCLLMDECDLIFECKICRALFRDLPNFISHKRVYCTKSSLEERHVSIAALPEEKVVVIQPQAPEETGPTQNVMPTKRSSRPSLNETIQRIQSGELGKSEAYNVYTDAAEKLQRQKETMKISTIRTTPIPTNKNAVFIDVRTTCVNIHERQQQNTNQISNNDPGASRNKKPAEKDGSPAGSHSTRHHRKASRQEKDAPEPQKLLLEHLKKIQNNVKQKTASQGSKERIVKQKSIPDDNLSSISKNKTVDIVHEHNAEYSLSENSENIQGKIPQKNSTDLNLARQNLLSLLTNDEAIVEAEKRVARNKPNTIDKQKKSVHELSKESATEAAKQIVKSTARGKRLKGCLTCPVCSSIFSSTKSLGFHMKIHHSSKRIFYQCPYCPSSFYYFFGITRHLFNNHSKTSEEINKMRAQLRDKAIVKPAPPPKEKKETFEGKSSRRRANRLQDDETDKDPKKRSRSNLDALSSETFSNSEENKVDSEKETSIKKKKYLQKTAIDNIVILEEVSESEGSYNTAKMSKTLQTNEVPRLVSDYSAKKTDFNKDCTKCHKSFASRRLYDNHVKMCQHDPHLPKDQKQKLSDEPRYPIILKNSIISMNGDQNNAEANGPKLMGLKNIQLNKDVSGETFCDYSKVHEKETTQLVNSVSDTASKRSVSVDRDVVRSSRNPNQEVEKEKRDSSAESTQSNLEGRPVRSRRTVPSRYAVVTNVQKSPQKSESAAKSDAVTAIPQPPLLPPKLQKKPESEDSIVTNAQIIFPMPKLQKRPDHDGIDNEQSSSPQILVPMPKLLKKPEMTISRTLAGPTIETRLKTAKGSYKVMVVKREDLQNMLSQAANSGIEKTIVKMEAKRVQGRPQKTYFSPRLPNISSDSLTDFSSESPQITSPEEGSSSPQKLTISASFLQRRSLPSMITTQKAKNGSGNKKRNEMFGAKFLKTKTPQTEEDTNSSIADSDTSQSSYAVKRERLEAVYGTHSGDSEKTVELLDIQSTSCEDSDSKSSKASDKTVSTLPASALSERPKRKRKIPNRNLGAKELLSKIHNRAPDVPSKKIRMSSIKQAQPTEENVAENKKKQPSTSEKLIVEKDDRPVDESVIEVDIAEEEVMEEPVRSKGRVVSNRIYVLNESKSKGQKLKCYDQTRVAKFIDADSNKCLECEEVCTSISNLKRHVIRQHLKWSRYKCKLCRFESYDRSECTTHLFRTHKKIAAHNFSSKRTLNSLIIDLHKEGLQARNLKKTKTLQGKQQAGSEGNIYARPNVRKVPRLPERTATLSTRSNQSQVSSDDSSVSKLSIKSKSPSSLSNSPNESWVSTALIDNSKKITSLNSAKHSDKGKDNGTPKKTATSETKKNFWLKLSPTMDIKKALPFNISTRNSPRTFDTSPVGRRETKNEELILQTRKGKYTKPNVAKKKITQGPPADGIFSGKISKEENANEIQSYSKTAITPPSNNEISNCSEDAPDLNFNSGPSGSESEHIVSLSKAPTCDSKQPTLVRDKQTVDTKITSPVAKASVKYFIANAGPSKSVEKTPKTLTTVSSAPNKLREVLVDNSPGLSDEIAKSLMTLKKIGDSMNSSKTSSPASSSANPVSNPATASQKLPVTNASKNEAASSSTLPIPLSLASGSSTPSYVLTRGASGKLIVYTQPTEEKQTSPANVQAKIVVPKSKPTDTTTKSAVGTSQAQPKDDSLPSGTFVIKQHFL